jgi:hypothetical protein
LVGRRAGHGADAAKYRELPTFDLDPLDRVFQRKPFKLG